MDKNIVLFLDDKKYPNADISLELLKKNYEVLIIDLKEDPNSIKEFLNKSDVYYLTIVPEIYKEMLNSAPLGSSLVNPASEDSLKEFKDHITNNYPELFVERMKLNSGNLDPLTLARLFESSPSLSVKIQTNGMPFINKYSGMDSFMTIDELNQGLVTPATRAETESTDPEVVILNHDYILQVINPEKFVMIKVTERVSNNLTWYDTEKLIIPFKLSSCIMDFKVTGSFYMYLKELKEFKISAVFTGINYHVDPIHYL